MDQTTRMLLGISSQLGELKGEIIGMRSEQARLAEAAADMEERTNRIEKEIIGFRGWAAGAGAIVAAVLMAIRELWNQVT